MVQFRFRTSVKAGACAALIGLWLGPAPVAAAPMGALSASGRVRRNRSSNLSSNGVWRRGGRALAPFNRGRAGRDAAVAAALGIGILGIAAAAAAANQPRGVYQTEYPVDAWGRPIYGSPYGYGQGRQYYQGPVDAWGRPIAVRENPSLYQPRQSRWEREQIRAQQRAQREAARQAAWEREQRRVWREQQRYARPTPQPGYGYGGGWAQPRLLQPSSPYQDPYYNPNLRRGEPQIAN